MAQLDGDVRIQEEVVRELRWDSRIEGSKIGVTVNQGVITLMDLVGSFTEKWAAQDTAHRVAGVLGVANDLQVQIAGGRWRTNTEIVQAARQALAWEAQISGDRVRVTVSEGYLTLEGSVDCLCERQGVEDAVRRLAGVRGINNHLALSSGETSDCPR